MDPADAMPTKQFFVDTITKDISLADCLLDLLDNCLDGARRTIAKRTGEKTQFESYAGFRSLIHINEREFRIEDNCGGISVSDAIDHAFQFGRHPGVEPDAPFSIGIYGIGMKRAIFKIGKFIEIHSSTTDEAFICTIDVPDWLEKQELWEFPLRDAELIPDTGTRIRINKLNSPVAQEFSDVAFANALARIIGRDYALFIEKGFEIKLNGKLVPGYVYSVRSSSEFKPYRKTYKDGGVTVEILAGMAAPPPDSIEPTDKLDTAYFGWFVLCNDRVILAADKTDRTVWSPSEFTQWHSQYNGFMGMALFHADDPSLLPWTTTKRDIDVSSPLYRRAVTEMMAATRPWVDYTNRRKTNLEQARANERAATSVPLLKTELNSVFSVPAPRKGDQVPMVNIQYQKPKSDVRKAAVALGNSEMSNKLVGEKTFEYYVKNEVDE